MCAYYVSVIIMHSQKNYGKPNKSEQETKTVSGQWTGEVTSQWAAETAGA